MGISILTRLWIAFIFLYLWDTTQLCNCNMLKQPCCELLSFFCIFEIQHNCRQSHHLDESVVNCFHFSVSLRYNTTCWCCNRQRYWLWIAFIFLYLWDTTQLLKCGNTGLVRCELLSFFCIFEIQHNTPANQTIYWDVVNCFHFSVSLRYNTTRVKTSQSSSKLWIAFIFLYLWDTTQLIQV